MHKSPAQLVRHRVARKRLRAREAGFCCICFKQKPNPERTVCLACNAVKAEYTRRKRQRDREAAKLKETIALQERAGDMASTYHLYADATHYYEEALNAPALALTDRERIAEKVA